MVQHIALTADALIRRIKHFLITEFGKVEKNASIEEFYEAFSMALREEIMINWVATQQTKDRSQCKTVYYLSMEFLPGKMLENNITNLGVKELLKKVLEKTNRSYHELIQHDPEPGLGNGGLGRLASCFLDSLATLHYPAVGYGLRYQYGIFSQEFWNGMQVERPDPWLLNYYPWEFRRDSLAQSIYYRGSLIPGKNVHGDEVYQLKDFEEVRALPYDIPIIGYSENPDFSIMPLRLWTTKESPKNFELQRYNAGQLEQAAENVTLTDVLYPNDNNEIGKRIRLKQEFLLVSASLKDIFHNFFLNYENIHEFPEKVQIQINDTHPAFIIAELTRMLTKNYNVPFDIAWEITKSSCNYTNHTVLKEALEEWNEERVFHLLPRQYKIIQKINDKFCRSIRQKHPNDEEKVQRMSLFGNGQIRMANLAIYGSKHVNGVSEIHTEIIKKEHFHDFYELYPEKFISITNGVTPRRWLINCNPDLTKFINERIGDKWMTNLQEIHEISNYADDEKSQKEFLKIKKKNKKKLANFLSQQNPIRNHNGEIIKNSPVLSENALYDVQIKRIHEYKRQLMNALHAIMLMHELENDINARKVERMIVLGGKSAPGYVVAKQILQLFFCISRKIEKNNNLKDKLKVVLIENYNVSKAEIIIPGTDLSEQISTAGKEASGTGNMKLTLNGALTIATEDGANIEMRKSINDQWWPFSFGLTASEIEKIQKENSYNAWDIFNRHENVKKALLSLTDGTFAESEAEHNAFKNLFHILLNDVSPTNSDPYFVLKDLVPYYETQKKVEELYSRPLKWAEYAIHNIAGMGKFSSDVVIHNYAASVWNLDYCPVQKDILENIREEFTEHTRCRLT